jgi:hypothetical protein
MVQVEREGMEHLAMDRRVGLVVRVAAVVAMVAQVLEATGVMAEEME